MENGFSRLRGGLVQSSSAVLSLTLAMTGFGAFNAHAMIQEGVKPSVVEKKAQVGAEHAHGELVVKMRPAKGVGIQAVGVLRSVLARSLGAQEILEIHPFQTDSSLLTVKLRKDSDLQSAIETLRSNDAVEYAEPNFIYRIQTTDGGSPVGVPNDADFAKLWGIRNVGQADPAGQVGKAGSDVGVVPLWEKGVTGSKDIVVAVIDTGVDHTHPDLAENIFVNDKEIPGNGIDDDGNGFVDDVRGYNFNAHTADAKDDHGHGTHCSGTIGGVGNNGVGVAGVNWNVRILPVKFLSASGSGSLEGAVEAINYARKMKVNIMSNSWGGGGFSQTLLDAIKAAKEQGILFVAAAGNESNNNDASPTYPASYEVANVISVAATNNQDQLASFSNYGANRVHISAPGVKIWSTFKDGGYTALSGTSMATPHAAGVAALLLSANPSWTYTEMKDRLIRTSDPVRGLRSRVMSKGRINANNAYYNIVPPSSEPDPNAWRSQPKLVESTHPYKDGENSAFRVTIPGAKHVRVVFDKVDVESKYDFVSIESASGEVMEQLTGKLENRTSEYVDGDTVVIRLKSDTSNTGFGFKVSKVETIGESR